MLRRILLAGFAGVLLFSTGCTKAPDPAADAQAIRSASEEWAKTAVSKDAVKFVSYYTDDATVMLPNEPVLKGKDAIKAVAGPMMQDPNFAIAFTTDKVEVSGTLGYTQGTVKASSTGRDGKRLDDTGKYLTVWKKQEDGSWKAVQDIFNSDLPLPVPTETAKAAKK